MDINKKLEEFKQCFDNSPIAFAIIYVQGETKEKRSFFRFCYANEAYSKFAKRHTEQFINIPFEADESAVMRHWFDYYYKSAIEGTEQVVNYYNDDIKKYVSAKTYQIEPGFCANVSIDISELKIAEQKLEESRMKYELAISNSDISIWEYDIVNDIMKCMPKSYQADYEEIEILQYSKSAIEKGIIHKKSHSELLRIIAELKSGNKTAKADIWKRSKDGEDLQCERIHCVTIFDEEGMPCKAYGTGRDVTKEKEAEAKYNELKTMNSILAENNMALFTLNLSQNTVETIKSQEAEFCTLNGLNAKELLQYLWKHVTDKDSQAAYKDLFCINSILEQYEKGSSQHSIEVRYQMERGKRLWVNFKGNLMKNPINSDVVAFIHAVDIQEKMLSQLVVKNMIQIGFDFVACIFLEDNSYMIYESNDAASLKPPKFSDNYEKTVDKMVLHYVHPEDKELCHQKMKISNIKNQFEKKQIYEFAVRLIDFDGDIRIKRQLFCYLDEEKEIILHSCMDMTTLVREQKEANERLAEALNSAEQANKAKTEFLANMSHEIRTPMNAIIGLSEIAKASIEDKKVVKECMDKSMSSAKYLMTLINDILDMSRIERGKVDLEKEKFSFAELVDDINTIIIPLAEQLNIQYMYSMDRKCHGYYYADMMRIKQIFINLLNNAIKFTQQGGKVVFRIESEQDQNNEEILKFIVSDNGIGMSKEFSPKVFEPFAQEHAGSNTQYGGSGLGLAICKNFIDLMGGTISLESELGVGTRFTVYLKLERKEEEEEKTKIASNEYYFAEKRVLVVEDHPLNIVVAKNLLEQRGILVDVAENGQEGVSLFQNSKEFHYDAVLMDIRMPVMDGMEAAKEIRRLERRDAGKVPIIAMTANAFAEDIEKTKSAGMNAHLIKPINSEILYETLWKLIENK